MENHTFLNFFFSERFTLIYLTHVTVSRTVRIRTLLYNIFYNGIQSYHNMIIYTIFYAVFSMLNVVFFLKNTQIFH